MFGRSCPSLADVEEYRRRCRVRGQAPVGVRAVPIATIVGSVDRAADFDRCFRPLRRHLRRRVAELRRVFPEGAVPAVELVRIGESHFVVDGHKRIAAARAAGAELVDAHVVGWRPGLTRC